MHRLTTEPLSGFGGKMPTPAILFQFCSLAAQVGINYSPPQNESAVEGTNTLPSSSIPVLILRKLPDIQGDFANSTLDAGVARPTYPKAVFPKRKNSDNSLIKLLTAFMINMYFKIYLLPIKPLRFFAFCGMNARRLLRQTVFWRYFFLEIKNRRVVIASEAICVILLLLMVRFVPN